MSLGTITISVSEKDIIQIELPNVPTGMGIKIQNNSNKTIRIGYNKEILRPDKEQMHTIAPAFKVRIRNWLGGKKSAETAG